MIGAVMMGVGAPKNLGEEIKRREGLWEQGGGSKWKQKRKRYGCVS